MVTGTTGFIGKGFIIDAAEKKWNITAIVRKNSPKVDSITKISGLEIVELNMDEYSCISKIGKFDCLMHFAWNGTRGSFRADEELQKSNYENSVNLINAAIENGCKKILTAGSQAEYGLCNGLITEETICNPNTAYGYYKNKLYETTKIIF